MGPARLRRDEDAQAGTARWRSQSTRTGRAWSRLLDQGDPPSAEAEAAYARMVEAWTDRPCKPKDA